VENPHAQNIFNRMMEIFHSLSLKRTLKQGKKSALCDPTCFTSEFPVMFFGNRIIKTARLGL
jgi:hypothetical protein